MSTLDQQDIASLRQRINRLEAQVDYLYRFLGTSFVENSYATDDPLVVDALRSKSLIEAIKVYRERTGVGLAEAKAAVEDMQKRLGL
jgi:GDP-D-mannose dehydratase